MKNVLFILLVISLTIGYSESNQESTKVKLLQSEIEKLKNMTDSKNQIATFLTFQDDRSEEAMNLYVNLFENSKILNIKRWGKEGPGTEGKVMHAMFELNGNLFMCSDSPPVHAWGFTPAVSNFVECKSESEIENFFNTLSQNGKVMMPLNNYGFSQKFGFVEDQFGVSWQLNLI